MALNFKRAEKPARKLRKLLKKMPSPPGVEDVHDFRTQSRQLEATLDAFGLRPRRLGRRILKPLARLRKRAGKVRDMDVLTGYVASLPKRDGEKDCSVQLLEYLGAQRRKYAKKFDARARRDGTRLRKRLKKGERKFARLESQADNHGAGRKSSAAQVPASALDLAAKLQSPARLDRTNLHPFRLKVKELRNVLKLAANPDQDLVQTLGGVKDEIGEWHDWQDLIGIAEKTLDHGAHCHLIRQLKHITQKKYETALAQAEQLRRHYLGASRGEKSRRAQHPHLGQTPVLSAAMKLAA